MFQFRAFPSYAYLIQRTIRRYCLRGFPHSEISGSTDICSSPKLIAACHVLRRLLMPRHSPCALYSLTLRDILVLLFGIMQAINRLLSQNCNCYPHLFRCSTIKIHNFSSTFVETFCCLAFITFQYIVQFSRCNSLLRIESLFCFAKLQFLLLERSSSSTERRIICRAARAIESFSRFEARSQDPVSWVLRSNGKIGTGGPEWARTTDLTIISRTL